MLCTAPWEGQWVLQVVNYTIEFRVYSASGMPVLRSGHPVLGYSMMCKAIFCQAVYFINF